MKASTKFQNPKNGKLKVVLFHCVYRVGYTVMPDRVEFWQGQTSRLHDRINFFRLAENEAIPEFAKPGDDGWFYERLAP